MITRSKSHSALATLRSGELSAEMFRSNASLFLQEAEFKTVWRERTDSDDSGHLAAFLTVLLGKHRIPQGPTYDQLVHRADLITQDSPIRNIDVADVFILVTTMNG